MLHTLEGTPWSSLRRRLPFRPRAPLSLVALAAVGLSWAGWPAPVQADSGIAIALATPGVCPVVASIACFAPAAITESAGATVTWTNNTLDVHTATSCDPQSCAGQTSPDVFHTGDILPGASASVRLTTPGTYHYFCTHHGYMNATITVRPSEVSGAPSAVITASPAPPAAVTAPEAVRTAVPSPATITAPAVPGARPAPVARASQPAVSRPPAPAGGPATGTSGLGVGGATSPIAPSDAPEARIPTIRATPASAAPADGPGPAETISGALLLLLGLGLIANAGMRRWLIGLLR